MTTLRTANEPQAETEEVKPSNPDKPSTSDVELSPTLYSSETGKPYLAKHLELENVWKELDHDTQSNAELIDEYFQSEVKNNKVRADKVGYRDYLRKFEKLTDTQNAPLQTKITKISEFIRYLQRTA